MKTLVIGLDGASPELLLEDERLLNLRRLMEVGSYGRLESVIPPTSVPAWMCLATGQDPGSLGLYGCRNRSDRAGSGPMMVNSRPIAEVAIWDQVARGGGRSVLIGVPPVYPPPQSGNVHAIDLPPRPCASDADRMSLRDEIVATTRKHFAEVRHLLQHEDWSYMQLVETGLDRMQRAFGTGHDPAHLLHEPESPDRDVIREYYRLLDGELGSLLELLSEETMVLVVSTHGDQKCNGGFCVNEWLVRQGLLTLHRYPSEITPFDRLAIDWGRTRVWSEGGDCAFLFFNVRGRQPEGIIEPSEFESFRAEVKARLEATTDLQGRLLLTRVFEPEQIYRSVRNVAPDLIVQFGGMSWRSIDSVGHPTLHLGSDEIEEGGCSPSPEGAFVLAVPGLPGMGVVEGASLLDIAPTLLELGGHEPHPSLQGRSLVNRPLLDSSPGSADLDADELLLRDRLRGLGYLG